MYRLRLCLRSSVSLSSPICQLYRQISSLPLQNHPTPSSAAAFPIPRDPSSPPLKLPTEIITKFDYTASHVLSKVTTLTYLSNLDAAAEYARLAVLAVPKNLDDTEAETLMTCQCIIVEMCNEKRFQDAYDLFHYFFNVYNLEPDTFCCTYIIYALCSQGRLDEAIQFYRYTIKNAHLFPESDTLMNALIDAGRVDEAYSVFFGGFTYPDFIRAYLAHGNIDKANKLFQDLEEQLERYPDIVSERFSISQVAYMEYYFKQGKDEEAMRLYDSVVAKYCLKPVGSYSCKTRVDTVKRVLQVLLKYGKKKDAWSLFEKLCGNSDRDKDVRLNEEAGRIMIHECFETGEISKAMEMAQKEAKAGNSRCYTTLFNIFFREGMMSEAEEIFNEMYSSQHVPIFYDLCIYRTMVNEFVKAGRFDDAHRVVNKIADGSLSNVSIPVPSSNAQDFLI